MGAPALSLLIATVPWRRAAAEALLAALPRQSRQPDRLILMLDGYGTKAAPRPAVKAKCYRFVELHGPGARWQIALHACPQDLVVTIDDDIDISGDPGLIARLADAAGRGAAAASGNSPDGAPVLWNSHYQINGKALLCGIASAMAVPAAALAALPAMAAEFERKEGYSALGRGGDDEALVSACLWRAGITIRHCPAPGLRLAPGSQARCETQARLAAGPWDRQRRAMRRLFGWPWPTEERS